MAIKEITAAFDPRERLRALAETAAPGVQASIQAWQAFFATPAEPVVGEPGDGKQALVLDLDEDPDHLLWHYLGAVVRGTDAEWFVRTRHVDPACVQTIETLLLLWRKEDVWLESSAAWLDANPDDPRTADRRADFAWRLERKWQVLRTELASIVGMPADRVLCLLQGVPWPIVLEGD